MKTSKRRNFLADLGLGAAGFSIAAAHAEPGQMPGRPSSASPEPSASRPSSIMAIAAHPGDAFFTMGAAVALQVHLGSQGIFVSLSLGEKGSPKIAAARYGTLQREASERAAQILGARASFLTYSDGEIPVNDEAKFAVCDLIREYKPGVIVTHWRGSWHKDHIACNDIVNDAVFYAALPAISRKLPAHTVAKVFFADNWEDANGFMPDTYLDITPVFDAWFKACAVFPMWHGENGFRYSDYYRSLAVAGGCLNGSEYAVALMSPPEQLTQHVHAL